MSEFVVHDTIKVLTQNGECCIELCLGDITKLKRKDKVDVILVSSFRGDYVPTKTSVIGALKHNLGIDVGDLSTDKEEDLRTLYSCWWSKPLPNKMPYKRLLCFETKYFGLGRPQEMVANVFRCLVPILNNEDGTVITSLLNTGDQGFDKVSMLQGMVVAAVNWMKAGLPLRLLKIVLYAKIVNGTMSEAVTRQYQGVYDKFADLKERYDSQYLVPKAVNIEYDIYLSYSDDDKAVTDSIQAVLKATKPDIRIYGDKQAIDSEAVWQQDMYQVMRQSSRVVTVLSPHYLKSTECIEQYNIALCCNRRAHRDMLAPFYVDSVQLMPTYMGLVQYVDCRPNDNDKIHQACKNLLLSITATVHLETMIVDPAPIQYDIFLSYSHKDDKQANHIIKLLQKLAPDLRVFFDIQELKTGKAWQRTLYHSIDGSRCLLALISESYTKSSVCQEEYTLALAKHCSGDGSLQLIPLCIEEMKEVPATFGKVKMTRATPDVFDSVSNGVCKAVVSWLNGRQVDANVECILKSDKTIACNMDKISEDKRRADLTLKYGAINNKLSSTERNFATDLHILSSRPSSAAVNSVDIAFSCAHEDLKYAMFLKAAILNASPSLIIKSTFSSDKERQTLMENARLIVAFLSPSYLDSPEQIEEFNIALCRERVSPNTILFPVTIHALPQKPTYVHIVPTPVNINDGMWAELASQWSGRVPVFNMIGSQQEVTLRDEFVLGLHEATCLIIETLTSEDDSNGFPTPRPVLHNVLTIHDDLNKADDGSENQATVVDLDTLLITLDLKNPSSKKIQEKSHNKSQEKSHNKSQEMSQEKSHSNNQERGQEKSDSKSQEKSQEKSHSNCQEESQEKSPNKSQEKSQEKSQSKEVKSERQRAPKSSTCDLI